MEVRCDHREARTFGNPKGRSAGKTQVTYVTEEGFIALFTDSKLSLPQNFSQKFQDEYVKAYHRPTAEQISDQ